MTAVTAIDTRITFFATVEALGAIARRAAAQGSDQAWAEAAQQARGAALMLEALRDAAGDTDLLADEIAFARRQADNLHNVATNPRSRTQIEAFIRELPPLTAEV